MGKDLAKLLMGFLGLCFLLLGVPLYGVHKEKKGEKKGRELAENKQCLSVAEKTTEIIKKDREIEKESDGMSNADLLDSLYALDETPTDSK